MKYFSKKYKLGFTLVESLVAIGILTLAITGTFTAIQSSLQTSSIAKDQITAFYLAQDAMEFIKNKRDENALTDINGTATSWLSGMAAVSTDPCYFGKTCYMDVPLRTITTCSGTCPVLRQDTLSGLFGYTGSWPVTNFTRSIQLTSVSTNEIIATITMSWTNRGATKTFQVSELIFNRE